MAVSTRSKSCRKRECGENQDCILLSVGRYVGVDQGQERGRTKGHEWVLASGVQMFLPATLYIRPTEGFEA